MKKSNFIKKLLLLLLVILYSILSMFFCYIITSSVIYSILCITIDDASIGVGIIGGADTPTAIFIMTKILNCNFSLLFVFFSIVTIVLLTVSIFKKQKSTVLNVICLIFLALSIFFFIMIPLQSYIIPLYYFVSRYTFLKFIQFFYIIISLMIIAFKIFQVIKSAIERT